MREVRTIMGMPVQLEIVGPGDTAANREAVFSYFRAVDEQFSTYKDSSEVSRINQGALLPGHYSSAMREVLALAEKTKQETKGYFDCKRPDGVLDPSGVVKGWAIERAAELLASRGVVNMYVEIGGDIQSCGTDAMGKPWSVGIRNPFNEKEIIKVIYPQGSGVATSGSYVRGQHIYNPHVPADSLQAVVSMTVVGPTVLEADRFATAAFAMGVAGITYIEGLPGLEGYAVDAQGIATLTSGFEKYTEVRSN